MNKKILGLILIIALSSAGFAVYKLVYYESDVDRTDIPSDNIITDVSTLLPSSEDLGENWEVEKSVKKIDPKVFANSFNSTEDEILGWGFENGVHIIFGNNGQNLSILLLEFSSNNGAMELINAIESFAEKEEENLSIDSLGDFSLSYICRSCGYVSLAFKKESVVAVLFLTGDENLPEKEEVRSFAQILENNITF